VGQIAQTIQAYEMIKSTTEISRMDPIEKIGIVLEGTLLKLEKPAEKEFAAFLLTIGVTRLAIILAGWAASHFVGVGEVIDIFLGAALAIGCLLAGWTLAVGVGQMIDATNDAVDAQNQRDLDAASAKMAEGIKTLGVALISLALVRGTKTGAGGKVSAKSASVDSEPRVQLVDPEPQRLLPPGPSDRRLLLNPGPSNDQKLLTIAPPKLRFGENDLVYGPMAGGKLRALQQEAGGKLLGDKGQGMLERIDYLDNNSWTRAQLDAAAETGRKVRFDITNLTDTENVLENQGKFADTVTGFELRYIRDNWEKFNGLVHFYKDGAEVAAPWLK
jgi:hypothetical protein